MSDYFYVIMPISADPEFEWKRAAIKRISDETPVTAHFPFEHFLSDLQRTLAELNGAAFVLADLSYERPSCYYELGLAQAIGKNTCIMAKQGTPIHQIAGPVHYYEGPAEYEKLIRRVIRNRFGAPADF